MRLTYREHVHQLAAAFNVELREMPELPPEIAAAHAGYRIVKCKPVADDTSYAVALHELGHLLHPSGAIRHITKPDTPWQDARLMLVEEEAAWEWAEHNALEWTAGMQSVKAWALQTYRDGLTQAEQLETMSRVMDDIIAFAPPTREPATVHPPRRVETVATFGTKIKWERGR